MLFEYKCLPLPVLEKTKETDQQAAALERLASFLNEQGADGWQLDRQDRFRFEQKSGLMGRGRPKSVEVETLVFKRERSENASAQRNVQVAPTPPSQRPMEPTSHQVPKQEPARFGRTPFTRTRLGSADEH